MCVQEAAKRCKMEFQATSGDEKPKWVTIDLESTPSSASGCPTPEQVEQDLEEKTEGEGVCVCVSVCLCVCLCVLSVCVLSLCVLCGISFF